MGSKTPDYSKNPFNVHVMSKHPWVSRGEAMFGESCWDAALAAALDVLAANRADTRLIAELQKLVSMNQRQG